MSRPAWWNSLHDRAFARLTVVWQPARIVRGDGLSFVAFDDLVEAGVAEVQRHPLTIGGVACGEKVYFRLAPRPPA